MDNLRVFSGYDFQTVSTVLKAVPRYKAHAWHVPRSTTESEDNISSARVTFLCQRDISQRKLPL